MSGSKRRRRRHTLGNVALDDQYDAAADHLADRLARVFPNAPTGAMLPSELKARVYAAFDAATADPARCCPHVDPLRPAPWRLDLWRGLLSCDACRHPDQLRGLPGDEEHRCDLCRGPMLDADMCALVIRTEMVATVAAVCVTCYDGIPGLGAAQNGTTS